MSLLPLETEPSRPSQNLLPGENEPCRTSQNLLSMDKETSRPSQNLLPGENEPCRTSQNLLSIDKQTSRPSQNAEERNGNKKGKRPTDEDYAQLEEIIVDQYSDKVYNRENLLGKGGFSRVYQVREEINEENNNNENVWADKVVSIQMLNRSKTGYDKVQKEITIHRELSLGNHNNIVRLVYTFEDFQFIHIILEICTQGTLHHVIKAREKVDETEARYYINQVLQGIQFIHQKGILHCDIKPANVMLTHDMVAKIGDFGLACRIGEEQPAGMKGTPNFVSPELLNMQNNWEGSDVWAAGVILFTLIHGHTPFEAPTLEEIYDRIKRGDYNVDIFVSSNAKDIIDSMLAQIPEERGHLRRDISVDGYLLTHSFFTESFMPRKLPACAAITDEWNFDFFDGAMPRSNPPEERQFRMRDVEPSSQTQFTDQEAMTEIVNEAGFIIADQGAPSVSVPQGPIQQKKENARTFLDRAAQNLLKCQIICSNSCYEYEDNVLNIVPVFVKRWVSTSHGLVFELTDGSTGVLFEDRSRIAVKGESVETIGRLNHKLYYPNREDIQDTATLAQLKFEDFLFPEVLKIPDNTAHMDFSQYVFVDTNIPGKNTQMKRWKHSQDRSCFTMELSNHVVQVEADQGTIRAIVWEKENQMYITVVSVLNNEILTYSFASFFIMGCPDHLRPLIDLALQEIAQMLRKRASLKDLVAQ